MLLRPLWWATFALLLPMNGFAAPCPLYSTGLHHQHQSLISIARSEILNKDDPSSVEVAKSEAKIKAKSQLAKERGFTVHGVFEISTCQSGEFVYASIKLTPASQIKAGQLSDEIARSIESQPTPPTQE